jgi:hypothetical protein
MFTTNLIEKNGQYIVEVLNKKGLKATFKTDDVDKALDIVNSYKRSSISQQERLHEAYLGIYGREGVSRHIERVSDEKDSTTK